MIKIEPDLPKPSAEPPAFLAGPSNGLLVKRELATRGVKIHDAQQTHFGIKQIINSVQERIKAGDLVRESTLVEKHDNHLFGTDHRKGVAEGNKT